MRDSTKNYPLNALNYELCNPFYGSCNPFYGSCNNRASLSPRSYCLSQHTPVPPLTYDTCEIPEGILVSQKPAVLASGKH